MRKAPNALDLVGQKFNMLTVLEYDSTSAKGEKLYRCRCDCGVEKVLPSYSVRTGKTKSCGCAKYANINTDGIAKKMDLEGSTVGFLEYVQDVESKVMGSGRAVRRVLVLCRACGNTKEMNAGHYVGGTRKSCGCMKHAYRSKTQHLKAEHCCPSCGETKTKDEFYWWKGEKRSSWCKVCTRKKRMDFRNERKQK